MCRGIDGHEIYFSNVGSGLERLAHTTEKTNRDFGSQEININFFTSRQGLKGGETLPRLLAGNAEAPIIVTALYTARLKLHD